MNHPTIAAAADRGTLVDILSDGRLCVNLDGGAEVLCDWLENGAAGLSIGDCVLVIADDSRPGVGVVLGRIGRYKTPTEPMALTLTAVESLTLQCGESSLTLRASGKVMLKGDDVLVRAKGTQRIRAGTVSIN